MFRFLGEVHVLTGYEFTIVNFHERKKTKKMWFPKKKLWMSTFFMNVYIQKNVCVDIGCWTCQVQCPLCSSTKIRFFSRWFAYLCNTVLAIWPLSHSEKLVGTFLNAGTWKNWLKDKHKKHPITLRACKRKEKHLWLSSKVLVHKVLFDSMSKLTEFCRGSSNTLSQENTKNLRIHHIMN